MSRLEEVFRATKRDKRAAFVPYVTAGDPNLERTVDIVRALVRGGADVLEIGVPFSDPVADGPTNQRAAERALAAGTSLKGVLAVVKVLRQDIETPIVLFTYANPVVRYGIEGFTRDAAEAGVDGVLFTDVPAEEMSLFEEPLASAGLDPIMLVTPTSEKQRMKATARFGRGFLYLVSRTGVTGARQDLDAELEANVRIARRASRLPVAVGFGISTPEQVAQVAALADGVVVGSAIVRKIEEKGNAPDLVEHVSEFVSGLVKAVKQ